MQISGYFSKCVIWVDVLYLLIHSNQQLQRSDDYKQAQYCNRKLYSDYVLSYCANKRNCAVR